MRSFASIISLALAILTTGQAAEPNLDALPTFRASFTLSDGIDYDVEAKHEGPTFREVTAVTPDGSGTKTIKFLYDEEGKLIAATDGKANFPLNKELRDLSTELTTRIEGTTAFLRSIGGVDSPDE